MHAYHYTLSQHSWLTLVPTDVLTIQGGWQVGRKGGGGKEEEEGRRRKGEGDMNNIGEGR